MIERGSGRTSGLTDWRLMDVHSMWACLQDQDTTGQWKQVAGWRKICDLALAHVSRLREYRRGLAEAWPPETNAAARAYLGELDQLIDQVQRTHDAAAANYDALAAATRAIGSTRAELKPLFDEYAEKVRQKQAYEAVLADPKAVAGSRLPEKPPVTDADLEQLNVRARGLMTGLSGELQQAQVMLRQPPPRPNIRRQPDESAQPDHVGAVPVIPPIVPAPIAARTTVRSEGGPLKPVPVAPPPAAPPVLGAGPILGGVGSSLAPTSPIAGLPSVTTPAASGQPIGMAAPPPTHGYRPNSAFSDMAPNSTQGSAQPINRPATGGASALPNSSTPRALPPGGLIGATPSASQPGSKVPRRANPIGGVIGGGAAGTAPSGAAGSRPGSGRLTQSGLHNGLSPIGGAPRSGTPSAPRGFSEDDNLKSPTDREPRSWDPDNPWEVDEGVSPIVRSSDEDGPIDPGPAIGLDR